VAIFPTLFVIGPDGAVRLRTHSAHEAALRSRALVADAL
jgi:hypothetical protein